MRADRGGIGLFVRDGLQNNVVHVGDSDADERSWHVIHSKSGPILLCVWYRRPDRGEIASIRRFEIEFRQYSSQAIAFLAVGDFNVHNKAWLRFSNADAPEGLELESVCCSYGLRQHVKEPTRGPYLLDLVLSDFESGVTCKVTPGIHDNDHRGVLASVRIDIPACEPV